MKRAPDIKLDLAGVVDPEKYGRRDSAAWTLFQVHPTLGVIKHSEVYMRRDELLREYESFGSYPMIARPR